MGFGGGGGGGGGLPGGAGLGDEMGMAQQLMGMMPQMGDLFGGQGLGSTFNPNSGLWGSPAGPATGQQSNLDQLMQTPAAQQQQPPPGGWLFGQAPREPATQFLQAMFERRKEKWGNSRSQYQAGGRK